MQSQTCSLPGMRTPAKSSKDLGGYCTKVHEIVIRRIVIIVDVKATIGVAIFSSTVERGVSIFPDTCHKSVTITTSLERAVAISTYHYKACSIADESLVKINSGENNANVRTCMHPRTFCKSATRSQRLLKFIKFFIRSKSIIGSVNAMIRVAILPAVIEC